MNKKNFIILLGFILSACATGYHPMSLSGGFDEAKINSDTYRISFRGNAFTSSQKVQEMALLRAADLALGFGYRYFAILDGNSEVRTGQIVTGQNPATFSVSCYGNSCDGTINPATTTTTPISWASSNIYVKFFKERPQNISVFDANETYQGLKSKYKK